MSSHWERWAPPCRSDERVELDDPACQLYRKYCRRELTDPPEIFCHHDFFFAYSIFSHH